jgi:molecular chaperone GrpE
MQALQAELNACKEASELSQQRYIQVLADMQNYKRRMEKDQLAWTRRAQESVLSQLLPIVDDFDRAIMEHKKHGGDEELSAWMVGFEMISKELYKFLKSVHVTEITEISSFDPELHEAVAQVESDSVASGDIVEVVQKGYMLADQVLRPAKVTVAR